MGNTLIAIESNIAVLKSFAIVSQLALIRCSFLTTSCGSTRYSFSIFLALPEFC